MQQKTLSGKKKLFRHFIKIFFLESKIFYEVAVHTLPRPKCIKLLSVRSTHHPFKMHWTGLYAFKSPLYLHGRANRSDQSFKRECVFRRPLTRSGSERCFGMEILR